MVCTLDDVSKRQHPKLPSSTTMNPGLHIVSRLTSGTWLRGRRFAKVTRSGKNSSEQFVGEKGKGLGYECFGIRA